MSRLANGISSRASKLAHAEPCAQYINEYLNGGAMIRQGGVEVVRGGPPGYEVLATYPAGHGRP